MFIVEKKYSHAAESNFIGIKDSMCYFMKTENQYYVKDGRYYYSIKNSYAINLNLSDTLGTQEIRLVKKFNKDGFIKYLWPKNTFSQYLHHVYISRLTRRRNKIRIEYFELPSYGVDTYWIK